MSAKQILIDAKELLVTKGRGRLKLYDPVKECYCLLGAVGKSAGMTNGQLIDADYDEFHFGVAAKPVKYLIDQVAEMVDEDKLTFDYTDVYAFNDTQGFDKPVLDLLDRAIEEAPDE